MSYYEKNKEKINAKLRERRANNPELLEKERQRYHSNPEKAKLRSRIRSVRGRLSYNMLSKAKKLEVDREIEKIFGKSA
mgnify:FL=1|jgi:hypothetical protein|tara:strand:- start:1356 stop:1592 length:237 start_codon:yes stop_codon:yes gene_type:complete